MDNYSDGRDKLPLDEYNSDEFESPRKTKRIEEKKRKGDASNEFEKDNSKNKKTREEKQFQNASNDETHPLEDNTPKRSLSNAKNLHRTHSASSQRSDDYSEDNNRDVYRFFIHIWSLLMHTTC
jgi:hypothetical protein